MSWRPIDYAHGAGQSATLRLWTGAQVALGSDVGAVVIAPRVRAGFVALVRDDEARRLRLRVFDATGAEQSDRVVQEGYHPSADLLACTRADGGEEVHVFYGNGFGLTLVHATMDVSTGEVSRVEMLVPEPH